MSDDDLQAIRAKRMAELQQQMGNGDGERQAKQEEMMRQQEEMKNNIMSQVLSQEARARINTIKLTKPDKAAQIEAMLVNMARSGQLQEKLSEAQLKSLLERFSEQTQKTTSVKFDRRRAALDSDDDDY